MLRITSHASCGPVLDINVKTGEVRIARMSYTKGKSSSVRHIMESGKAGQTVFDTLRSGLLKEGADDRKKFEITFLSTEPALVEFCNDEKHPGGTHIKVVYPVFVPEEQLRSTKAQDDDDRDETHGAIEMVTIEEYVEETKGNTVPFHFRATMAVLAWAAANHPMVARQYSKWLGGWRVPQPNAEQKQALESYPAMQ